MLGGSQHGFQRYQEQYRNTICGQHPIAVMLHAVRASSLSFHCRFVKYAQSSAAKTREDSSVSYASAVISLSSTK